jgi:hypothetical protein
MTRAGHPQLTPQVFRQLDDNKPNNYEEFCFMRSITAYLFLALISISCDKAKNSLLSDEGADSNRDTKSENSLPEAEPFDLNTLNKMTSFQFQEDALAGVDKNRPNLAKLDGRAEAYFSKFEAIFCADFQDGKKKATLCHQYEKSTSCRSSRGFLSNIDALQALGAANAINLELSIALKKFGMPIAEESQCFESANGEVKFCPVSLVGVFLDGPCEPTVDDSLVIQASLPKEMVIAGECARVDFGLMDREAHSFLASEHIAGHVDASGYKTYSDSACTQESSETKIEKGSSSASIWYLAKKSGHYPIGLTVASNKYLSKSAQITVVPKDAVRVEFIAPSNQRVGSCVPIVGTFFDMYDNQTELKATQTLNISVSQSQYGNHMRLFNNPTCSSSTTDYALSKTLNSVERNFYARATVSAVLYNLSINYSAQNLAMVPGTKVVSVTLVASEGYSLQVDGGSIYNPYYLTTTEIGYYVTPKVFDEFGNNNSDPIEMRVTSVGGTIPPEKLLYQINWNEFVQFNTFRAPPDFTSNAYAIAIRKAGQNNLNYEVRQNGKILSATYQVNIKAGTLANLVIDFPTDVPTNSSNFQNTGRVYDAWDNPYVAIPNPSTTGTFRNVVLFPTTITWTDSPTGSTSYAHTLKVDAYGNAAFVNPPFDRRYPGQHTYTIVIPSLNGVPTPLVSKTISYNVKPNFVAMMFKKKYANKSVKNYNVSLGAIPILKSRCYEMQLRLGIIDADGWNTYFSPAVKKESIALTSSGSFYKNSTCTEPLSGNVDVNYSSDTKVYLKPPQNGNVLAIGASNSAASLSEEGELGINGALDDIKMTGPSSFQWRTCQGPVRLLAIKNGQEVELSTKVLLGSLNVGGQTQLYYDGSCASQVEISRDSLDGIYYTYIYSGVLPRDLYIKSAATSDALFLFSSPIDTSALNSKYEFTTYP